MNDLTEISPADAVAFVLIGTTHTGNIGAVARAMKTMGFTDLRLVDACRHRTEEAIARASGAADLLYSARCFESLEQAIADCHEVVGTSARVRDKSVPVLACREVAEAVAASLQRAHRARPGEQDEVGLHSAGLHTAGLRTAILFGQERSGLSNDELDLCTRQLRIPCNPDFSSLNLGSAAQVVAYEFSVALSVAQAEPARKPGLSLTGPYDPQEPENQPVNSDDMARFFEHLERVLIHTGYLDPTNPRQLMRRLRHYFEANRPSVQQMSILRGVLAAVERPKSGRSTP